MQRIILLGEDHTALGDVAVDTLGPMAAALTRGRHPKAYPYVDANEDALLIASDGQLHLMAVADGHNGTAASHAAIRAIHDAAPTLADLEPVAAASEATLTARDALVLLPHPNEDLPRPATTLTVIAIRGDAGAAAGWGDSVAVQVKGRRTRLLTSPSPDFRAAGTAAAPLEAPTALALREGDRLVAATDGLTDFLPRPWYRTLGRLLSDIPDPTEAVRAATVAAGEGGGGDNIAVCLFRQSD